MASTSIRFAGLAACMLAAASAHSLDMTLEPLTDIWSPTGGKITIIGRGPDWIPLRYRKDIEPGSALDFSGMGFTDAPAGK